MKRLLFGWIMLVLGAEGHAQDPSFAQFFSSPLNINPALTGVIKGKWRMISNYRDQWISAGSPYTTGTVSVDTKLLQDLPDNYVDENYRLAIGGMFMYDQAMAGVFKSNYASFNISGNILLASGSGTQINGSRIRHNDKLDGGTVEHRIGAGFGMIYGNRRIDFTQLTFGEQFTGRGFDTNLPTGESALVNMKSYYSMSAGLIYNYVGANTNVDLGVSAFHFNKPKQTVLDDNNSVLPIRYVAHGNIESMLTDQLLIQANGIYQYQNAARYFSVGGALGYYLSGVEDENNVMLNLGLWYWSENAVIPYVGFSFRGMQIGATYDITLSDLNTSRRRPKTFELSLILRGDGKGNGVIPAPWK